MDDLFRPPVNWRDRAACIDTPLEWFFPMPGPNLQREVKRAKAICASCPVQADCLDYALEFVKGRYITLPGIYGGMTEPERWKFRHTHMLNSR